MKNGLKNSIEIPLWRYPLTPICLILVLPTIFFIAPSDNHTLVNDDEAAPSTCRPTLKLLKGELLSITWSLLALKRWQKKPSFYDPWSMAVSASPGPPESRLGAVVTVWPLTFYCLEEELRPDSSSRQILYSYEIFLVLSAIYFTYTVLKLPSDAQFFF